MGDNHRNASAMSQVAAPMSTALPRNNIAGLDFFNISAHGLLPVDNQPRHLQSEQR